MPTAAIVLLCVAGFICLLLIARVHLTVTWRERVRVRVRYLFIVFPIIPKKVRWRRYTAKRAEKERRIAEKHKAEHKAEQKKKDGEEAKKEPQKPFTFRENLQLVRALVAVLVRRTQKHLRLDATRVHLYVATGDAASTAVAYGAVSASLAYLIGGLERVMRVHARHGDVTVVADYLSEKPRADVKLRFSLPVGSALALAVSLALAYLKKRRAQHKARRAEEKETQTAVTPAASPAKH